VCSDADVRIRKFHFDISFTDVGTGSELTETALGGIVRATTSTAQKRNHFRSRAWSIFMRAIGQLERRGIVKEVSSARRDRAYCAKRLLQIFEEPPQLKPATKF
jgi:hypothetical protein